MIKMLFLKHNLELIISRYSSHKNILDSLIDKKEVEIESLKDAIDEITTNIAEKETICRDIRDAQKNIRDDKKIYKVGYRVGAIFILLASAMMHYLFDNNVESMFLHTGIIEAALPIVCGLSYFRSTYHDKRTLKKYNYDTERSQIVKLEQEKRMKEHQLSEVLEQKDELVEKRKSACINLEQFELTLKEITEQEVELIKQPEVLSEKYESVMSLILAKQEELNTNWVVNMEKKQKLESNLVELETKYQNLIQGLDKLIKLRDDAIKDNQQVIDDASLKIIDKEKLCDELLNADIKIMVSNMKYKSLVLLTLIAQAVFGVILMPETIEFISLILSVGALEIVLYFAETHKARKLLKKHDYFSEYKELQDLYEIKKWREFRLGKLLESKEVHVAKKVKYQKDLEQIEIVLADLLSLNVLLVNEPHVIDAQYTQIMSLIREKKEQLNDQNY